MINYLTMYVNELNWKISAAILQQDCSQCFMKGIIYVSTAKEDFEIPLIQIFSYYLESKKPCEEKSRRLPASKQQGNLDEGNLRYAYHCLWFLRFTLQGFYITKKPIPDPVYKVAVLQLTSWVFNQESTLLELLSIDSDLTFGILHLFFKPKCVNILKSEGKSIKIHRVSESDHSIEFFSSQQQYKTLNQMIDLIFFCEKQLLKKSSDYSVKKKGQFYLFVAKLIEMNQFDISIRRKMEVITFLLQNPYTLDLMTFDEGLNEEEIELKKNLFLEKIIISCGKKISQDEKAFEDLLHAAETSPL